MSMILMTLVIIAAIGTPIILWAYYRPKVPSATEQLRAYLQHNINPYEEQFGVLSSEQICKIMRKGSEAPQLEPPILYPFQASNEEQAYGIMDRLDSLEQYLMLREQLELLEEPEGLDLA